MDTYFYWYAVLPNLPFSLNTESTSGSITVERIGFRALSAAVAEISEPHVEPCPQSITEHNRMVLSLLESSSYRVLPMRFGTILSTRHRILTILESRYDEWTRLLHDIEGSMEMSLKVLWVPPNFDVPSRPLQSRYFSSRLQTMRQQKNLETAAQERIDAIDERLKGLYLKRRMATTRRPELLMNGDYLIPRPKIQGFQQTVRTLMDEMSDYRWLCTGPWPPYHFVS